jgi:large subunit ribosomal protein L13
MRNKMAQMALMEANKGKTTIVDATGAIVGRLASALAKRLLLGETIVVVNSERAVVSGRMDAIKARYQFKTTVGTRRKGPYPSRMPHLLLKRTVRGMMQYQRPNGRAAYKRLTCHIGVPAEFQGKPTEKIEGAIKQVGYGMTLGEIAQFLGKNIEVKTAG